MNKIPSNKNKSQSPKLPQRTKKILTFQTTSKNKNKSQLSKLPQRTKKNLNLPNYLDEQKHISTFQTTSKNKK
jgi:hypothetical protein